MAGLILFIACSNVASLMIARAIDRQRDTAGRLESILLSIFGASLGTGFSVGATRGVLNMLPVNGASLALHAEPDVRILLFTVGIALLFRIVPALQATRLDLVTALKESPSGMTSSSGSVLFRKALVVGQVGLSFLLLVAAGLFARMLANLKGTHTGFENAHSLTSFQIDPAKDNYTVERTLESSKIRCSLASCRRAATGVPALFRIGERRGCNFLRAKFQITGGLRALCARPIQGLTAIMRSRR